MRPVVCLLARRLSLPACFGLVWLLPTAVAVFLKWQMIGGDGLTITAHYLGKVEVDTGGPLNWLASFTPLEILSFYRGELLWGLLILPAVSLLLTSGLPARWRAAVLAVASFLLTCVLYAEVLSIRTVGRLLSLTLTSEALTFNACCAPTAREYFGLLEGALLLTAAALTVGLAWWAARQGRRTKAEPACRPHAKLLVGWGLAYALTLAAWLPWLPTVPYHTSVFASAVTAFFSDEALDTSEFEGLPPERLAERYRELTHSPTPRRDPALWGKAQGCDVLVVILETAPARCLAIDGDLPDCPNLARLRRRAWVGTRHHSAYAYTSRAVFSILSSWYPSTLMKNFPQQHPQLALPGLMRSLGQIGYQTALYAPDEFTYRNDDAMYHSLGIGQHYYAERTPAGAGGGGAEDDKIRRPRLDRECLRELKEDMARWHKQDQRFAALFLPQLGHGPWHDFTDGGTDDLLARGRKIISMQDAWMGEILDQLDRAGRLDKTLIVVVGDHGIRARREDRNFRPGMIDDYSFRVPLLIYAPPALQQRTDVAHLTSHVDIAPSVLDLLGVDVGRESEQGTPVWDDRTAGRHVYFLANHLFGADGYFDGRRFFMWNHLSGAVYENDRLHFEVRDLVPKDSPRYREVVDHLRRVTALQEVWASCRCGVNVQPDAPRR